MMKQVRSNFLMMLCVMVFGSSVYAAETYRVFVSTDLGGDPDDMQSMIHMMHYTDILKIEGIISTAGPGSEPKVDLIREWVMRADLDHLRKQGHTELMSEEEVVSRLAQGAVDPQEPKDGADTDGSRLLIERAHAADPLGQNRPLWVLVWGSMTDVAQALHDDPTIAAKIRIYSIGSSNTVADPKSREYVFNGMKDKWKDLWWIENGILPRYETDTFRGYYQGGDQSGEWGNKEFILQNIRGHGTTHNGMFEKKLGDAFPTAGGKNQLLKEGDSPSFTYLLSPIVGGVGNVDDPTAESWGGSFRKPHPDLYPNYYCDLDAPAKECQATINRWRKDYLGDWKQRWGWYGDE